jgi:hypothetical protein
MQKKRLDNILKPSTAARRSPAAPMQNPSPMKLEINPSFCRLPDVLQWPRFAEIQLYAVEWVLVQMGGIGSADDIWNQFRGATRSDIEIVLKTLVRKGVLAFRDGEYERLG